MTTITLNRNEIVHDRLSTILSSFRLHVLECGEIITSTNKREERPFSHMFRINYVVKGTVYFNCCNKKRVIPEGSLIFLFPEQMTEVEEGGDPVHIMFINFEISDMNHRQQFISTVRDILPDRILDDPEGVILSYFNMIRAEDTDRQSGYALIIENYFRMMLVHVFRRYKKNPEAGSSLTITNRSLSIYNECVGYITSHISENIRVSEMADHMNISEIYLYKIFSAYANCSPKEYITKHRMNIARSYLSDSDEPIKNISEALGYPDPNYFSAAFKKENGLSPAQYRSLQKINRRNQLQNE